MMRRITSALLINAILATSFLLIAVTAPTDFRPPVNLSDAPVERPTTGDLPFTGGKPPTSQLDIQYMRNPAAVYCSTLGYEHQIVAEADGSQHGVCILSDQTSCDEWDFLEG